MISVLFKEIKTGQLRRMAFLGYWVLLILASLGFVMALAFSIGIGEQLLGGDLAQAQDKLRGWFALPAMIAFMGFMLAVGFAQLNIVAKRIRHMGLPGWWTVLAIGVAKLAIAVIVGALVGQAAGEQAGNIVGLIVALSLLFIPGGTFGQSQISDH